MNAYPLRYRLQRGVNVHAARVGAAGIFTACGNPILGKDALISEDQPVTCQHCQTVLRPS